MMVVISVVRVAGVIRKIQFLFECLVVVFEVTLTALLRNVQHSWC